MTSDAANSRFDATFSSPRPVLETARLLMRPFLETDACDIERLAGDSHVAQMLLAMPHPYPVGAAVQWIAKHEELWNARRELPLAITRRDRQGALAGAISLHFVLDHQHAEVGYWIAHGSWGDGIASEATAAVLHWAFVELGLHRVFARHMVTNPASGAVMRKNGMRHEGTLREHHWKHGRPHDFHVYGILRSEYLAMDGYP